MRVLTSADLYDKGYALRVFSIDKLIFRFRQREIAVKAMPKVEKWRGCDIARIEDVEELADEECLCQP